MNPFDPNNFADLLPDVQLKVKNLFLIAAAFVVAAIIALPFALLFGGIGWGFFSLFIATAACYAAGGGTLAAMREGE